jgi:two-component system, LytTR family, sensor kinase
MAALREAMLKYENAALNCALDSGFFVDALMRIARALNDEAGALAGEIVLSLAERMRTALARREAPPEEVVDEAFPGPTGRAESNAMTDARLRRLLLIGALGVWAAFFCSFFLMEIVDGRLWWKSLSDYGGQSVIGALWFIASGRLLQKVTAYRVLMRCFIFFVVCVVGICVCAISLFLSFAFRGDLAWPPLYRWVVGFELDFVAPIFIGWAAVYFLLDARRREVARLNAAAEIREAALKARNAMLRQQVNPHFLFNALNALYALVLDRQFERAREMIAAVRRFLVRAGDPGQGELVALSSELAIQNAYLEIERVRFGDRLRVEQRIEAGVAAAKVPYLILQPLVENAVKYAVARTDRPVAIEIRARRAGKELWLAVADTGAPEAAPRPPGLGVGLRNVEARLTSLYGEAARLACRPLEPAGFLAEVRVPLKHD